MHSIQQQQARGARTSCGAGAATILGPSWLKIDDGARSSRQFSGIWKNGLCAGSLALHPGLSHGCTLELLFRNHCGWSGASMKPGSRKGTFSPAPPPHNTWSVGQMYGVWIRCPSIVQLSPR